MQRWASGCLAANYSSAGGCVPGRVVCPKEHMETVPPFHTPARSSRLGCKAELRAGPWLAVQSPLRTVTNHLRTFPLATAPGGHRQRAALCPNRASIDFETQSSLSGATSVAAWRPAAFACLLAPVWQQRAVRCDPSYYMATVTAKRAPVFVTVDQLRPDTRGHNLKVKVRQLVKN